MARKLYLYMARRDKQAVKTLTVLECEDYEVIPAIRVENIDFLNVPIVTQSEIMKTIYEHRLLWELWVETADNYTDLRAKIKGRGYANVPAYVNSKHPIKCDILVGDSSRNRAMRTQIAASTAPTMVRKQT